MSKKVIKGKITIVKPDGGMDVNVVRIELKDELSRIRIATIELPLEDFAMGIFGLAALPCDIEIDKEKLQHIGNNRVTRLVCCERVFERDGQLEIILRDFEEKYSNEWELLYDGIGTKQDGDQHKYTIAKYVEV